MIAMDSLSLDFGRDKAFHVYIYKDPRPRKKLVPIYVGKGKTASERADVHWVHGAKNPFLKSVLKKIRALGLKPDIEIVGWFDDEYEAFRLEVALIARIGRRDLALGPLLNLTDGGDGTSGCIVTPERRERHRVAGVTMWETATPELAARMSARLKLWDDPVHAAKCIENINLARARDMEDTVKWAARQAKAADTKRKPENRQSASEKQKAHLASLTPEEKAIRDGNAGDARRADKPETGKRSEAMWAREGQKEKQGKAISVGQTSAWADPVKKAERLAKRAITQAATRAAKEAAAKKEENGL